jgi:hypothetical protein
MVTSPPANPLAGDALRTEGDGADRRVVLRGINTVIDDVRATGKLFSELGVAWAHRPASIPMGAGG